MCYHKGGYMTELKKDILGEEDEEQFARDTLRGERALIGAVIQENSLMKHATEYLLPASFNVSQHPPIFLAMIELYKRKAAISTESITRELRAQGKLDAAGGEEYVTSLGRDVPRSLTAGQNDHEDRFIIATIGAAAKAAALSGQVGAEDVARILLERMEKFRALKGWKQVPLIKEDEGYTN
jgi:hypothetical protein